MQLSQLENGLKYHPKLSIIRVTDHSDALCFHAQAFVFGGRDKHRCTDLQYCGLCCKEGYGTVGKGRIQYSTVRCSTVQYSTSVQYSTLQYSIVQYSTGTVSIIMFEYSWNHTTVHVG